MNSWDIFYIALAIGFIIIVGCIVYLTYYLSKALKSVTELSDNIKSGAEDIKMLKDTFKIKALTTLAAVVTALIGRLLKKRG